MVSAGRYRWWGAIEGTERGYQNRRSRHTHGQAEVITPSSISAILYRPSDVATAPRSAGRRLVLGSASCSMPGPAQDGCYRVFHLHRALCAGT